MSEKSVTIIGAGLAGLSAGCYLQMNGYHSRIFEHHASPGGVAACWKRKGYLIDGGIHFVMNCQPGSKVYEVYRELGAAQANRFIEAEAYARFFDEATGRSLPVTANLSRLAHDLKVLSPADGSIAEEFMRVAKSGGNLDLGAMGLDSPPEIMGGLDWLRMIWQLRPFLKYFVGSYRKPIQEFAAKAKDPWLRFVLENMFTPEVPVWFVSMLLGMLSNGELGLLSRGSVGFVQPIEARYKDLGGEISYNSTVEEVLVEHHRAVGVRLADGVEQRSDVVVSAADGRSTIFDLLGGRYVDKAIRKMYRDWQLVRPAVMISYGVAREFAEEPSLTIMKLEKPLVVGEGTVQAVVLRIFNYSDRFAPPGKRLLQASFETTWDHWHGLREDAAAYEEEKNRVAREVLGRLESHYPGISGQVEVTDVATPYTTWRYTRNHKGAYMGWLATPQAIFTTVRRTLPGLGSFLMAGQWVMPGGGVAPSLYSGRHVAQILCHQDGKPFITSFP